MKDIKNLTPSLSSRLDHITPDTELQDSQYSKILQSKATNQLTKTSSKKGATIDPIAGYATLNTSGDITVFLNNYKELKLDTPTHKLLDALTIVFTQNVTDKKHLNESDLDQQRTITLSIDDYMSLCGLKDKKEAKKQLKKATDTLFNIALEWEETIKYVLEGKRRAKTEQVHIRLRVCDKLAEFKRGGNLVFSFSYDLAKYLAKTTGYIMPYPNKLFTLSAKYNPNSYYMGRRIVEHHNMNIAKNNATTIAVKTLLDATPELPSYEDVMSGNKNIYDRIIAPFERDLTALVDAGVLESWEYCNSKKAPLTQDQRNGLSYEIFSELYISFKLADYPNQEQRIRKIENRQARAKAKEEKQRKEA